MVSETSKKLRAADVSESGVKQVDPSAFTYMLINAVKELSQQNRELKAAVCAMNPKAHVCRGKPSIQSKDGAALASAR